MHWGQPDSYLPLNLSMTVRHYAALALFVVNAVLALSLAENHVLYPVPAFALLVWYVVRLVRKAKSDHSAPRDPTDQRPS